MIINYYLTEFVYNHKIIVLRINGCVRSHEKTKSQRSRDRPLIVFRKDQKPLTHDRMVCL